MILIQDRDGTVILIIQENKLYGIFYSPSEGNYTQSFSISADLNLIVFDMATTLLNINFPLSPTGWILVACDISYNPDGPTVVDNPIDNNQLNNLKNKIKFHTSFKNNNQSLFNNK